MASKHVQRQQEVIERRALVAKRRLAGVRDQRTLAAELGVSVGTINGDFKALNEQWKASALSDTDTYISLQNERYESLIGAHWEKAMQGKGFDTDRVLKAMDQQADLLGLKQPAKQHVEMDGGLNIIIDGIPEKDLP